MEFMKKYIKQHRKCIVFICIFFCLFTVAFALYRLPLGAVIYPFLLCMIIGAIFVAVDFIHCRKKHSELSDFRKYRDEASPFPRYSDCPEDEDYTRIISDLKKEINNLKTEICANRTEMTEYYTLWVHQIKTPISAMKLTLQNEDTELSRKLSSEVLRIEQYVEMVLVYLRLDSSSTDYVFGKCDIDRLIKDAVKKFASEFIGRKISLEYRPVKISAVTDEKWLSFVLEQILSNALKYTRRGCVKIYAADSYTICIEDTGIGIAPEDLPRIFEKGYTGYNGRHDKKASGIGLYLCKSICDRLGHSIKITSEPGVGTKVFINLEQYRLQKE